MKTKSLMLVFLMFVATSFFSCSKDDGPGSGSGDTIEYVVKATYDNPKDHDGDINAAVTNLAMTTPSGSSSVSLHCPTPLTIGKEWGKYPKGMYIRVTAESVLTHVTVVVEIWRNGVKWKEQKTMGQNAYVTAKAEGTL